MSSTVDVSKIACPTCGWLAALWNATGLGPEPMRCKKHQNEKAA